MQRVLSKAKSYCRLTFAKAALVAVATGGCGHSAEPAASGAAIELEGIWNADSEFSVDGKPYVYHWAENFRFDRQGDALSCVANGVAAQVCRYSGSVESFALEAVDVRETKTTVRTRTFSVSGVKWLSDDSFEAHFKRVLHFDNVDGSVRPDQVEEGKARLVRVRPFDALDTQGFRVLGEFNAFTPPPGVRRAHPEDIEEEDRGQLRADVISTANVRVAGDYAYVVQFGDGLRVLDIADPGAIRQVAHAPATDIGASYYNDVKLFDVAERRYAAVADRTLGMVIYDVTDPAAPAVVSSFFPMLATTGDYLNNHTLFMVGTTAYLANYGGSLALDPAGSGASGGLLIVDLSDPTAPKELGRWLASEAGGTFVHDLYVADGVAYLCAWEAGLVLLDVNDPANPSILGQFKYERMASHSVWVTEVAGRRIAVNGDEDFGAHLRLIDVTPGSPDYLQQISEFQLRPEVSVHNVVAFGSEVTAAWYQDGVRVLDISQPTSPKLKAWHNTWKGPSQASLGHSFFEGGIGVEVQGNRVYLADIQRGLIILERE